MTTTTTPTIESPTEWSDLRRQGFRTLTNPTEGDNWYLRQDDVWVSVARSPEGELEISIRQGGRADRHWLVQLLGPDLELLASAHGPHHADARSRCQREPQSEQINQSQRLTGARGASPPCRQPTGWANRKGRNDEEDDHEEPGADCAGRNDPGRAVCHAEVARAKPFAATSRITP